MSNAYEKWAKDTRPWGTWEIIETGENFCVKHICVNPKGVLSLQSHNHRREHWIMVAGNAIVTLGEEKFNKKAGEHVYIPAKMKHRIQNEEDVLLEFIEIQYGECLDENDIIRYEDIYGRI